MQGEFNTYAEKFTIIFSIGWTFMKLSQYVNKFFASI